MSVEELLRSKPVRIFLLILLLVLIGVGVFFLLRSPSESHENSLDVGPKVEGKNFIRYDINDRKTIPAIKEAIFEYLKPYNTTKTNIDKNCNPFHQADAGKTCDVDLGTLDPCTERNSFGYYKSTPCVFLKLTKDAKWTPRFYNVSNLPESMPTDLQNTIKQYAEVDIKRTEFIWVSCAGKTEADQKNLGSINYYPRQGFPGFFYPCSSSEGCNQPLIAIEFRRLTVNEKIFVECKLWAENVSDTVEFQIMEENLTNQRS